MQLIDFVQLGLPQFAPAIALGVESHKSFTCPDEELSGFSLNDCLLEICQQAGGYSMVYPTVVGFLFPFSMNKNRITGDANAMIQAFSYMAEDPQPTKLKRVAPGLYDSCGTAGGPLGERALRGIDAYMSNYLAWPNAIKGHEAFVQLDSIRAMRSFAGWQSVGFHALGDVRTVEDWSLGQFVVSEGPLYSMELVDYLCQFVGVDVSEVNTYLLWENCD